MIGNGPEFTVACKLVQELNIEEHVLFLGKQENVAELFSISDLKLLLSEKESFGLVLLEAMACGVPVVGTNIGGIPEVILDGETGYICELGDIDGIARASLSILTDESKKQRFSYQAMQHVRDHFHSSKIVEDYEQLYYSVLKG